MTDFFLETRHSGQSVSKIISEFDHAKEDDDEFEHMFDDSQQQLFFNQTDQNEHVEGARQTDLIGATCSSNIEDNHDLIHSSGLDLTTSAKQNEVEKMTNPNLNQWYFTYASGGFETDSFFDDGVLSSVPNVWEGVIEGIDDRPSCSSEKIPNNLEAQEAEVRECFQEGIRRLKTQFLRNAALAFLYVIEHPIMASYHANDWNALDAKITQSRCVQEASTSSAFNQSTAEPNVPLMGRLFFCASFILASLARDPVPFYRQALSVRKELPGLWWNAGWHAAKIRDWASADYCLERCLNKRKKEDFSFERRVLQSLLLVYYFTWNLPKLVECLRRIYDFNVDNNVAHAIRQRVSDSCPIFSETLNALLPLNLIRVENSMFDKIIKKLDHHRAVTRNESSEGIFDSGSRIRIGLDPPKSPNVCAQFKIFLPSNIKMSELSTLLSELFDRIEAFSSIIEQVVELELEGQSRLEGSLFETSSFLFAGNDPVLSPDILSRWKSSSDICYYLRQFLRWMATDLDPQDRSSFEQKRKGVTRAESFRFVFDRWLPTVSMTDNWTIETLFIFRMAIQYDSVDALQIFKFHFGTTFLHVIPYLSDKNENSEETNHMFFNSLNQQEQSEDAISIMLFERKEQKDRCGEQAESCSSMRFCALNDEMELLFHVYNRISEDVENGEFSSHLCGDSACSTLNSGLNDKRIFIFSSDQKHNQSEINPTLTEICFTEEERLRFRLLKIRIHWMLANLSQKALFAQNEFIGSTLHQTEAYLRHCEEHLGRICSLLSSSEEKISDDFCATEGIFEISLNVVEEALKRKKTEFHSGRIRELCELEQFQEIQNLLVSKHYNWDGQADEDHVDNKLLLVRCHIELKSSNSACSLLSQFLTQLRVGVIFGQNASLAKKTLRRALSFFAQINIEEVDKSTLRECIEALEKLAIPPQDEVEWDRDCPRLLSFSRTESLWLLTHRLMKHLEGPLTDFESLHAFYSDAWNNGKNVMPTRALNLLMHAHDVLGDFHKCHRNEGKFLFVYLNELIGTFCDNALLFDHFFGAAATADCPELADVLRLFRQEIYQCLYCLTGGCLQPDGTAGVARWRPRFVRDHGSRLQQQLDWSMAERIIPLFEPSTLPEYYTLTKLPSELIEICQRIFPFLYQIPDEANASFTEMIAHPPLLEPDELLDDDGLPSGFCDQYRLEAPWTAEKTMWHLECNPDHMSSEAWSRLALQARLLYMSALHLHRSSRNDEATSLIRRCLPICGPFLDRDLRSSAWFLFARCTTNEFMALLSDEELGQRLNEFLFPFKMAIHLKPEFAEGHQDLATLMYQLRTRLHRAAATFDEHNNSSGSEMLKGNKLRMMVAGMLQKCETHFDLALRHNDGATRDVVWLCFYFRGKLAEKLERMPEEVFQLYRRSALALEDEGYSYPPKVSRAKQANLEPLELHYRVHAFALGRSQALCKTLSKSNSTDRSNQDSLKQLVVIHAWLRDVWHWYGVSRRGAEGRSAQPFYRDPEINFQQLDNAILSPKLNEENVATILNDVVSVVDYCTAIDKLCKEAFEVILSKFPHYKAAYRLARLEYTNGRYQLATTLLFDRIFFPVKKPPENAIFKTSIFDNICEFIRSDIDRSGSFAFHLERLVRLTSLACFQSRDLTRLAQVFIGVAIPPVEGPLLLLTTQVRQHWASSCLQMLTRLANDLMLESSDEVVLRCCDVLDQIMKRLKKQGDTEHTVALQLCFLRANCRRQEVFQRRQHLSQEPLNTVSQVSNDCDPSSLAIEKRSLQEDIAAESILAATEQEGLMPPPLKRKNLAIVDKSNSICDSEMEVEVLQVVVPVAATASPSSIDSSLFKNQTADSNPVVISIHRNGFEDHRRMRLQQEKFTKEIRNVDTHPSSTDVYEPLMEEAVHKLLRGDIPALRCAPPTPKKLNASESVDSGSKLKALQNRHATFKKRSIDAMNEEKLLRKTTNEQPLKKKKQANESLLRPVDSDAIDQLRNLISQQHEIKQMLDSPNLSTDGKVQILRFLLEKMGFDIGSFSHQQKPPQQHANHLKQQRQHVSQQMPSFHKATERVRTSSVGSDITVLDSDLHHHESPNRGATILMPSGNNDNQKSRIASSKAVPQKQQEVQKSRISTHSATTSSLQNLSSVAGLHHSMHNEQFSCSNSLIAKKHQQSSSSSHQHNSNVAKKTHFASLQQLSASKDQAPSKTAAISTPITGVPTKPMAQILPTMKQREVAATSTECTRESADSSSLVKKGVQKFSISEQKRRTTAIGIANKSNSSPHQSTDGVDVAAQMSKEQVHHAIATLSNAKTISSLDAQQQHILKLWSQMTQNWPITTATTTSLETSTSTPFPSSLSSAIAALNHSSVATLTGCSIAGQLQKNAQQQNPPKQQATSYLQQQRAPPSSQQQQQSPQLFPNSSMICAISSTFSITPSCSQARASSITTAPRSTVIFDCGEEKKEASLRAATGNGHSSFQQQMTADRSTDVTALKHQQQQQQIQVSQKQQQIKQQHSRRSSSTKQQQQTLFNLSGAVGSIGIDGCKKQQAIPNVQQTRTDYVQRQMLPPNNGQQQIKAQMREYSAHLQRREAHPYREGVKTGGISKTILKQPLPNQLPVSSNKSNVGPSGSMTLSNHPSSLEQTGSAVNLSMNAASSLRSHVQQEQHENARLFNHFIQNSSLPLKEGVGSGISSSSPLFHNVFSKTNPNQQIADLLRALGNHHFQPSSKNPPSSSKSK